MALLPILPRVAPFIEFGADENPASPLFVAARFVLHHDVVGEVPVLEVSETYEHRPSGLEIHASGQVDVRLLPEGGEGILWSTFTLDRDVCYRYSLITQLGTGLG